MASEPLPADTPRLPVPVSFSRPPPIGQVVCCVGSRGTRVSRRFNWNRRYGLTRRLRGFRRTTARKACRHQQAAPRGQRSDRAGSEPPETIQEPIGRPLFGRFGRVGDPRRARLLKKLHGNLHHAPSSFDFLLVRRAPVAGGFFAVGQCPAPRAGRRGCGVRRAAADRPARGLPSSSRWLSESSETRCNRECCPGRQTA